MKQKHESYCLKIIHENCEPRQVLPGKKNVERDCNFLGASLKIGSVLHFATQRFQAAASLGHSGKIGSVQPDGVLRDRN